MRQAAACSVFLPRSPSRGASAGGVRYVQVEGICSLRACGWRSEPERCSTSEILTHVRGVHFPLLGRVVYYRLQFERFGLQQMVATGIHIWTECGPFSSYGETLPQSWRRNIGFY